MPKLNAVKLHEAVFANQTSQLIYNYFQARQRNSKNGKSDLRQILDAITHENPGVTINQKDFWTYWTEMEKSGAGTLVIRKNNPPRFHWDYNLKTVRDNINNVIDMLKKRAEAVASEPIDKPAPVLNGGNNVVHINGDTPPAPVEQPAEQAAPTEEVDERVTSLLNRKTRKSKRKGRPAPLRAKVKAESKAPEEKKTNVVAFPSLFNNVRVVLDRSAGGTIEFSIPRDLSHAEAQELGDIVKRLR